MKIVVSLFTAVLVVITPSCSSGKKSLREYKGSYLESVRLNFEAGEQALKNGEYEQAVSYFQFVRSKYPFSKYAALSDLKIADTKFVQKKWLDAASAYEVFIRLHPRHENVGYASYRVGASYFHAVPTDFFLLPPATARDQSFTKEALAAIDRFIVQFPDSEYLADAKAKQILLFSYLAQHNQHVAEYYEKRGRYQAAVDRYLTIEELYPDTTESIEALYMAAEITRTDLKDRDAAIELYSRLITSKSEKSPFVERAKQRVDKLLKEQQKEAAPVEQ